MSISVKDFDVNVNTQVSENMEILLSTMGIDVDNMKKLMLSTNSMISGGSVLKSFSSEREDMESYNGDIDIWVPLINPNNGEIYDVTSRYNNIIRELENKYSILMKDNGYTLNTDVDNELNQIGKSLVNHEDIILAMVKLENLIVKINTDDPTYDHLKDTINLLRDKSSEEFDKSLFNDKRMEILLSKKQSSFIPSIPSSPERSPERSPDPYERKKKISIGRGRDYSRRSSPPHSPYSPTNNEIPQKNYFTSPSPPSSPSPKNNGRGRSPSPQKYSSSSSPCNLPRNENSILSEDSDSDSDSKDYSDALGFDKIFSILRFFNDKGKEVQVIFTFIDHHTMMQLFDLSFCAIGWDGNLTHCLEPKLTKNFVGYHLNYRSLEREKERKQKYESRGYKIFNKRDDCQKFLN